MLCERFFACILLGGLFEMGLYDYFEETYLRVTDQLSRCTLAYVHFVDQT